MLAVAREDQYQQSSQECGCFFVWEDLVESPPRRETQHEADGQRKDLPVERDGRNQARGDVEDRAKERAERRKGGVEFGGAEEVCYPRERPVVPIKACDGEQQSVGADGDEGKEKDVVFLSGAEGHSVIITIREKGYEPHL